MKDTKHKKEVKRVASFGFDQLHDLHALHGSGLCLMLLFAIDSAHLSALCG